jgi:ABC-type multidrug transport system fused ATPase/permease subunit
MNIRPLAAMPMMLVRYLRWKIAAERIVAYLNEPDVDTTVFALATAKDNDAVRREATDVTLVAGSKLKEERIGITNGYFFWNELVSPSNEKKKDTVPQKAWWKRPLWRKSTPAAPDGPALPLPPPETSASGTATPSIGVLAKGERRFELKDINVFFPPGQLTLVTGPTAAGKTALLRALLGEMYTTKPSASSTPSTPSIPSIPSSNVEAESTSTRVYPTPTTVYLPKQPWVLDESTGLRDYVSYAAQTPWLQNLSIKENIVFGSPHDEERYQNVLEFCALNPDLETFEDGDETEIGERGISLSGGQKARYVYIHSSMDILLLCTMNDLTDSPFCFPIALRWPELSMPRRDA